MQIIQEIDQVGKELGINPFVIRDQDLERQGFGGIYGVGKAAINPPGYINCFLKIHRIYIS